MSTNNQKDEQRSRSEGEYRALLGWWKRNRRYLYIKSRNEVSQWRDWKGPWADSWDDGFWDDWRR